jgi:hypothetical protein
MRLFIRVFTTKFLLLIVAVLAAALTMKASADAVG